MVWLSRVMLIALIAVTLGCTAEPGKTDSGKKKTGADPAAAAVKTPAGDREPASEPEPAPTGKRPDDDDPAPRVEMKTTLGTIVLELDRKKAPITVHNFLEYAAAGFYDGTIFHRVMADFMIQGGAFLPDKNKKKSIRKPIKNESPGGLTNARGTIAMARLGEPDSATAQFFINVVDNGYRLDYPKSRGHGYAVFGKVVEGMDVVDRIRNTPTELKSARLKACPVTDVVIQSVKRL